MQTINLVDLTRNEMLLIDGGTERYTCALVGGFTAVAFLAGQWWAVAGGLITAYNAGCFQS
ncbi:MAG TPA: hypothetical protein VE398_00410 [Acidobacteriota bacterium]|nr:hypothetical protein [Acidobacteriota bacterium]